MQVFWQQVLMDLRILLEAPLLVPEMWWIVIPLIAILLIMTFYFGKYICERLGWNSALSNSIVLIFVGWDLLRTMYHYSYPPSIWNFSFHPILVLIIFAIMFEGILLAKLAFTHGVRSKYMFFFASPLPVNIQAYIVTILVYLQVRPTLSILFAALILFVVLYVLVTTLKETEHMLLYHLPGRAHPCPRSKK